MVRVLLRQRKLPLLIISKLNNGKCLLLNATLFAPKEWLFSGPGAVTQVLMVEPRGVVQGPVFSGNAKAT